eukprot:gnl/MRDRNA2_/MRDRNA2_102842_c0_seq1.p1 gnl/MRDRNA2_/MRDRNA2_102842_c0~~gnl/MRDRNA2_/MRDRNA2_102842_c0_seq1.p1  ORF type:complete len:846 (-),score=243.30 gnl/MRDRNA2_/MRDRNA2_102842_c0_seq1:24-2450(-)
MTTVLGVSGSNGALLFNQLDIDSVGLVSKEQFTAMSLPRRSFRLTNLREEAQRFHVYEAVLFSDKECSPGHEVQCPLPIASGYFVDLIDTGKPFPPGNAFDGNFTSTRWLSECGPCQPRESYIGCKLDEEVNVRCIQIYQTSAINDVQDLNTTTSTSTTSTTSTTTYTTTNAEQRREAKQDQAAAMGLMGFSSTDETPADEQEVTDSAGSDGTRRLVDAKVSAGFRMLLWDGRAWNTLVDVEKPPLWEIDSEGAPLSFSVPIPEVVEPEIPKHLHIEQRDAQKFEEEAGMEFWQLVIISTAGVIAGLIVCCLCVPMLLTPECLRKFRVNAPEVMEKNRGYDLERQLIAKKKVEALEAAVRDKSMVTDEWGIRHKVYTAEQKKLQQKLARERKREKKLADRASATERLQRKKIEKKERRKRAHLDRLQRMREAYKSQTVAIDGVALRAPPAVLAELGFQSDLIEAFGLPGFEEVDVVDEDEQARQREEEAEKEMQEYMDEEARQNAEAAAKAAEQQAAADSGIELGDGDEVDPLQVPPRLEEIMGDTRTEGWKHRNRRNAMAGGKEGLPMDRGSVLQAERVASTLQMADLQEEDEVEEWLAKAADRKEREAGGGELGFAGEKIIEFEALDVDDHRLNEEKAHIEAKFSKRLHSTALTPGAMELLPNEGKKTDDTPSQSSEEDDVPGHHHDEEEWHKQGMLVFDENRRKKAEEEEQAEIALSPEEAEERRRAMWQADEEEEQREKGPIPYGGKVYPGMNVRPRGMGTPRRDLIGAEMMRTAYLAEAKDGVTCWGRIAYTKSHFNEPKRHK